MIRLDSISISFPGRTGQANTILGGITLDIARGDWVVLAGSNGSGKTTLLKALAGLVPLSAGSISTDQSTARPQRFSLMLQDPANQFVAGTVWAELLLSAGRDDAADAGARPDAGTRSRAEECARAALDRFHLDAIAGRNPHHLSGGEQQRLAMATVWLERPDVLLLDEPVSFLDEESRDRCVEFVRELNRDGITIIWASPGGDDLLFAGTIVYLAGGAVRFAGPRDRFFMEARRLGAERALPGIFRIGLELTVALGAGNAAGGAKRARVDASRGTGILTIRDVSFAYRPGTPVIRSVSTALAAGECVGVTGPNGSGKTTLLELAGKILAPDTGAVMLHPDSGRSAAPGASPACMIDCFYLFQEPERMFFAETVYDEIEFGLLKCGVNRDARPAAIAEALSCAGLDPVTVRDRSPFRLSSGEMRRLALAIALSLKPGLLLLDEPSACLDDAGLSALTSVLEWCRADGRGVMVASHDVDFLAETCDRILFLERGSAIGDLSIAGGELPPSLVWPGRTRPCVLDLQDALERTGTVLSRRVLSRGLFVRELLDHAEADVR